jgi:2-furoyl-CoA dehydrogenase large subunit
VVEPGMSNMGYLSTLLTPEARQGRGQNGAVSMVTVIDPLGAVGDGRRHRAGQGMRGRVSQIVGVARPHA